MLEMLSPCGSDHMSGFHPLTSAAFILNSPTWREVQLVRVPVPLNTSCLPSCTFPPRSTSLTHTNYSTLTQHACERQREGKGAGPGWLSVREVGCAGRTGLHCSAGERQGRREDEGRKEGITARTRRDKACGRCKSCTEEAAVRGGEVSVRSR